MKYPLALGLLSLLLTSAAQAQNPFVVLNAFNAARSVSATRARQQDPQEFTKPVIYENAMFHCKRISGAAGLRRGGAQIMALEHLLADRYAVLLTDTVLIFSPAWEAQYAEALRQV